MKTISKFSVQLMAAVFGVLMLVGAAQAQSPPPSGSVAAQKSMPPSLQRAIEAGDEATANALVKQFKLTAKPGEPQRYDCEGTKCSCFGEGCKGIAAACKEGSLECGLYQCTCDKK